MRVDFYRYQLIIILCHWEIFWAFNDAITHYNNEIRLERRYCFTSSVIKKIQVKVYVKGKMLSMNWAQLKSHSFTSVKIITSEKVVCKAQFKIFFYFNRNSTFEILNFWYLKSFHQLQILWRHDESQHYR